MQASPSPRILVINPNTTASMTAKIEQAARQAANQQTRIIAAQPDMGPASIEGYYDEAFSVPGLIEIITGQQDADAVVVACFDDTGVDAARCITAAPVIGIGEAAFHMAALISGKFSVVTTLPRSIAAIEHNLVKYGLASRCARVRAAEIPVLELEKPDSPAQAQISHQIQLAIEHDQAEAIVLGCAGMATLVRQLSVEHDIPVIDGVGAAVKLAEGLIQLQLTTSRRGAYAPPTVKSYAGMMARFAPR